MIMCRNCGQISEVDNYKSECPTCHTIDWENWYLYRLQLLRYDGAFLSMMNKLQQFNPPEFYRIIKENGIQNPDPTQYAGITNYKECPRCHSVDAAILGREPSNIHDISIPTEKENYICTNCRYTWQRGKR